MVKTLLCDSCTYDGDECPYPQEKHCELYRPVRRMTPYERTKAQVYATGNKWAIENFHATHD